MANQEHLNILKQGVSAWNEWHKANLEIKPDLYRANLYRVDLRWAILSGANLNYADLSGANLLGAHLSDADLNEANLRNANLTGVNLRLANLHLANLSDAHLSDAHLSWANLSGVDLTKATVGYTTFANVDLSTVKGLETIRHFGPSTIGIDTIYRSQGKIPAQFLRGAGVPDNFIEYMNSLVGRAFDFYSCFISYSSKDQEFAERLYADLQAKGVRCWFAPEDLKIGDKFRQRIDDAIRLHDKLLVVLSETSVNSAWVEKEVETAFEKERASGNKAVLFPIRLDEAVMKTGQAWAADIRRARHIGNFSNWKDHDSYQKAFQRLLRDLQDGKE